MPCFKYHSMKTTKLKLSKKRTGGETHMNRINESLSLRSTNHGNTIRIPRAIEHAIQYRSGPPRKVINLSK